MTIHAGKGNRRIAVIIVKFAGGSRWFSTARGVDYGTVRYCHRLSDFDAEHWRLMYCGALIPGHAIGCMVTVEQKRTPLL